MTEKEAAAEIENLRGLVVSYQKEYYTTGRSPVSDAEFDRLFDRLQKLEAYFPALASPDSPTRRVGSDLDNSFPEVRHSIPVLSLDKAYSVNEILSWMTKTLQAWSGPLSFSGEEKIDGLSIVLYYKNGMLDKAVTRGNGQVGNDITDNVRTIRQVPLSLAKPMDLAVRGEIVLPLSSFETINATMDPPYSNPRNLAAGTLRRIKSSEVAKVPLEMVAYDLWTESQPPSNKEAINLLATLGFRVPENMEWFGADDGEKLAAWIGRQTAERAARPYQIDGLVFKVDQMSAREELGYTGHHPRWAIAYKFESPQGASRLLAIDVQVGRTGRITPVARLEPVEIGGAIITNASLHNQDYIDQLDVAPGDTVTVSRRGDVIPAVERVLEKGEGAAFFLPDSCPACGTATENRGAHRFCPNHVGCPAQQLARLVFFAGRDQMDIQGLGSETIQLLFDNGFIKDIPDLFGLDYQAIQNLPGLGAKKAQLIQQGLEECRRQPFSRVLASLGIPDLGPRAAELLIEAGLGSAQRLVELAQSGKTETLEAIHGIGPKTAARILQELSRPAMLNILKALQNAGLAMAEGTSSSQDGLFAGQVWCVTGSFDHFKPREKAMELVQKRGGSVAGSVSARVTHLLAGEGAGSKLEKAQSLGISIVTEAEFLALLGPDGL